MQQKCKPHKKRFEVYLLEDIGFEEKKKRNRPELNR